MCVCLKGPWFGFIQGVEGLRFKVLGLGFSGVRGASRGRIGSQKFFRDSRGLGFSASFWERA